MTQRQTGSITTKNNNTKTTEETESTPTLTQSQTGSITTEVNNTKTTEETE
jgi:hypothetical protein